MEVKSNIEMIRAWKVDLSKVKEYLITGIWTDEPWVKELLDTDFSEGLLTTTKALEYFEQETKKVDFDEFKTFPPQLVLKGGSACREGDYILRFERNLELSDLSQSNGVRVFYQRKKEKELLEEYYIV